MGLPESFEIEPYAPPWWLPSGHAPSLWVHFLRPEMPAYRRERLDTPDGDFIDIDWVDAPDDTPIVVACHGLEGCSGSGYIRSLMHMASECNWTGIAFNSRGCSGEDNLQLEAYHPGWTVDLDFVVRTLVGRYPGRPIFLAAYSLGGSIVGNWLGRRATEIPREVQGAFLCSVPFFLGPCNERLRQGFGRLYQQHFLKTMQAKARVKAKDYPDAFDLEAALRARSIKEFESIVTCKVRRLDSIEDYYDQASCGPHLKSVRVPTLILNAKDDPIIPPADGAPASAVESAPAVHFVQTEHGGHVGFVSTKANWLEEQAMSWFRACLNHSR